MNLENWKIQTDEATGEKTKTIYLSFDIVNSTDMPLTLKYAKIYFIEGNKCSSPNIPLAPTKFYTVIHDIVLSDQKTAQYFKNGLNLTIFGNVEFRDNFGDQRSQLIGQNCVGGVDGFIFADFDRWLDIGEGNEEYKEED